MTDGNTNGDRSISNDTTSVVTAQEVQPEPKIPMTFEWRDGGHVVYVTGSFSNWGQWFVMTKNNKTGNFELTLELPKGIHQYKFIVDSKWVYSKHFPTCKDERGNINNIVDTSKLTPPKVEPKPQQKPPDEKNKQIEELKKNLAEAYTEYFPRKSEMNLDAPNIPPYYGMPFNIDYNSRQDFIGHKSFLNFYLPNERSENSSFKNITLTPHVDL